MKKCVQYYHCYRSYFNFDCTRRQEGITCMILCNQQDSEALCVYLCILQGCQPWPKCHTKPPMPRLRSSTVFWWAHETAGSATGTLRRKKTERCHGLDSPLGCPRYLSDVVGDGVSFQLCPFCRLPVGRLMQVPTSWWLGLVLAGGGGYAMAMTAMRYQVLVDGCSESVNAPGTWIMVDRVTWFQHQACWPWDWPIHPASSEHFEETGQWTEGGIQQMVICWQRFAGRGPSRW